MPAASRTWTTIQFPKLWIDVFFALVGSITFVLGFVLARRSRGWVLGQWLISYEGGFLRRGLPGEVFYLLGRLFHVTPVAFLLMACFLLYAVLFFSIHALAVASSRNLWLMALILSPATFWFQILHPLNGFNKEIFFLATLAAFALLLDRFQVSEMMASLYLSVAIVLVVLSHEGMLFYEPYFFALLVMSGRTARQALKVCAVPALLGLAVAFLCSRFSGTVEAASQICSSLGYKLDLNGNSQICAGGAIAYLTRSTAYARADTLGSIQKFHFLLVFPAFAAIALMPAIGQSVLMVRRRMRPEIVVLWSTVLMSFLGTIILFYYAYDWNRWIYIHVTSITVLLLVLDKRAQDDRPIARDPSPRMTMKRQAGWGIAFAAYAVLCITPNAIQAVSFGLLHRLAQIHHPKVSVAP